MPGKTKRLNIKNRAANGFDPLSVFQSASAEYKRLPQLTALIENHLDKAAQARKGFTLHNIFVSERKFTVHVFAVIVQWLQNGEIPITNRTVFSVDLEVKHNGSSSSNYVGHFTDVPLLDVVRDQTDGKGFIVGMLCIPVKVRLRKIDYDRNRRGDCFKDLNVNTKAGVRVDRMGEVTDQDMPFDRGGLKLDYVFALEYGVKKMAEKQGLFQVITKDPRSNDPTLALFPETFLSRDSQGAISLVIWVAHKNNQRSPITTKTRFTIDLTITRRSKENEQTTKSFKKKIPVRPIGVDIAEGFVYGLLIVSVPRGNQEENNFLEGAFIDKRSIEVEYLLTRTLPRQGVFGDIQ